MKKYFIVLSLLLLMLIPYTAFAGSPSPANGTPYKYYVYYTLHSPTQGNIEMWFGSNVYFAMFQDGSNTYFKAAENLSGTYEMARYNYNGETGWTSTASGTWSEGYTMGGWSVSYTIVSANFSITDYTTKQPLYTPTPTSYVNPEKTDFGWTDVSRLIIDYSLLVPYGTDMNTSEIEYSLDGTNFKSILDENGNQLPYQDINGNYISNIISNTLVWKPNNSTITGTLSVSVPLVSGTNNIKLYIKTLEGTFEASPVKVIYKVSGTYKDVNNDGIDDDTGKAIPKPPADTDETFDGKPDRANFPTGIFGDIAYYFAMLGYYVTMPLRLIKGGFETFINLIETSFSWVQNFSEFAKTFLGIFPPEVSALISMSLTVSVILVILKLR